MVEVIRDHADLLALRDAASRSGRRGIHARRVHMHVAKRMCSVRLLICSVAACCFGERISTPSRTATTACVVGSQGSDAVARRGQAPGRNPVPGAKTGWRMSDAEIRASQKLSRQG